MSVFLHLIKVPHNLHSRHMAVREGGEHSLQTSALAQSTFRAGKEGKHCVQWHLLPLFNVSHEHH